MACELQDRKTEQAVAPEDTTTDWVSGEYDITGNLGGVTDDDWARARDDAVEKARDQLTEKYTCVGTCDGGFCVLDVKVESNRAGRRVRRTIPNHPDSIPYKQGRRESVHTFLTYEVKVSAHCRCARRSAPPVISSGGTDVLIGGPGGSPPPPPEPPVFEWKPSLEWKLTPKWDFRLRYRWSPSDWRIVPVPEESAGAADETPVEEVPEAPAEPAPGAPVEVVPETPIEPAPGGPDDGTGH